MLVCPQCQFENPNTNNFCQRCGTSLTHKTCPQCGVQVSWEAEKCQNCGASTGLVWWAIIFNTKERPLVGKIPVVETAKSPLSNTSSSPVTPTETPSEPTPIAVEAAEDLTLPLDTVAPSPRESEKASKVGYLDAQQRYQLLEPPMTQSEASEVTLPDTTLKVRVLDCHPLQKTLLETLVEQGEGLQEAPGEAGKLSSIPAIAQPYLALKATYKTTLPSVHDAWNQDETSIVLLEDRSQWQLLTQLWGEREIPSLQILYWLDEMARLWVSLEPWHCRQSLLVPSNLRVDEDQALCLTLLYPETPEVPLTLKDLGKTWQELFAQSQRTQFGSLHQLFRSLSAGEIETVDALRQSINAIAVSVAEPVAPASTEPTPADSTLEPPTPSPQPNELITSSSVEGDDLPTVILPMQLLSLDDAGNTDIGRARNHNEDYFGIITQLSKQETPTSGSVQAKGLYVLCDGMGGHAAGEVASAMAVDTLKQYFSDRWKDQLPDEKTIREGVHLANKAIYDVNQQNARSGSGRMGTTLVMVLIQGTEIAVANVGDSRLYRYSRKRGLEQITVDHEVGQREIQRGVEPDVAYSRPDAYQLTQALGPRDENFVNPDVQFIELNEDTLLLLASDGLTDNDLLETHWETYLAPLIRSGANLDQGLQQLLDFANQHNGHDNITGILVRAKVRPNLDRQQPI